jgi:hypothetical protein
VGNNCKIDKAVMDLPEPLSPTMATSSPGSTVKELLFIAAVDLPSWLNCMERFFMDSRGITIFFKDR